MVDVDTLNGRLADTGWIITVEEDPTVGGSVIVTREQKRDENGVLVYDHLGDPVMVEVHEHVPLAEPVFVIVARRGDEEHRFSTNYDDAEVLVALWDLDVETARHDAHGRGEHAEFDARCQRCIEEKWAADAAHERAVALYGSRPDDVSAFLKGMAR